MAYLKSFASIFIFLLGIVLPLSGTTPEKKEKVIIKSSTKTLSFFINKKKEIQAKLSVSEEIEALTDSHYKYSRSIFFDDQTKIGKLERFNGKKSTPFKIKPIISDYESDGIFHSDLKICYFEHNLYKKGETVSFTYEKIFKDLKFLDPMYFNDAYKIENSELIIEVPEWLSIDIRELNFDLEKPSYTTKTVKGTKIHTYTLKDLAAAFKHRGAPRRSKMNAHLIVIPNAYEVDGQQKKLIEKVDDLYDWYASLVDQIGNDNSGLKTLVDDLTANQTEDLEKIKAIFYWVQDNIRYIAFEDGIMGFQPENCQTVFNNKYGDCKGMANLTKEMLAIAGYDARLTWLGTADVPYDYDIPSLLVDNHMICTVILNGEKIFLDPTEKWAALYNYAFRIQDQQALIEDGDAFMIERIPVLDPTEHKESTEYSLKINKENLEGEGKVTFTGNRKTYIFNVLSAYPKKEWEDLMKGYISNRDKNVQTTLKTTPELKDRDSNFELDYAITLEHKIIDLGGEMYINLETDYTFQKFDMDKERDVPYEFSGKYFIEQRSALALPEGWKVSYLPEAVQKEHKNYSFDLSFSEEENQVIYTKKIAIKEVLLGVQDFEAWNATIEQLGTFYSDQIIINKQ